MKDQAAPDTEFTEDVLRRIEAGSGRRALTFDAAKYQRMIDDADLTEDRKHELLGAMWNIIVAFVDLGFEVKMEDDEGDARRGAENSCGQTAAGDDALNTSVLDCSRHQKINESFANVSATHPDSNDKEKA